MIHTCESRIINSSEPRREIRGNKYLKESNDTAEPSTNFKLLHRYSVLNCDHVSVCAYGHWFTRSQFLLSLSGSFCCLSPPPSRFDVNAKRESIAASRLSSYGPLSWPCTFSISRKSPFFSRPPFVAIFLSPWNITTATTTIQRRPNRKRRRKTSTYSRETLTGEVFHPEIAPP